MKKWILSGWCHIQQDFSYRVAIIFIGGRKWRLQRKPQTCHWQNLLLHFEYTLLQTEITLTTIVVIRLGLGCLTPLSTIFQLYRGGQFYWLRKSEYPKKTNQHQTHLIWVGFKLTTLVVIGTNCIGSCKSNYHTITTTPNICFALINIWNINFSQLFWFVSNFQI